MKPIYLSLSTDRDGDDGGLSLADEPLDGLAVGLVAELTCELEDTCCADDGHADAAAPSIDLAVSVRVAS
ncbi:hypothetical protein FF1_031956 [Malus domestica]